MKTYYLVSEKTPTGSFEVFVSDTAGPGKNVLAEFESGSYSEAVKRFRFSVRNRGRSAYCGVDANGQPFHGEA